MTFKKHNRLGFLPHNQELFEIISLQAKVKLGVRSRIKGSGFARSPETKTGWIAAIMGARYWNLSDVCINFARLVSSLHLKMLSNLLRKWLWFRSHFHFQFSARLAPDRPGVKSFWLQNSRRLTDRSWLKLESSGCRVVAEGKRQKFCLRLVYRENSGSIGLLVSECLRGMPRRMGDRIGDRMGDSRFCTLGKIFWQIGLIRWQQFTSKKKESDDRVADRLSQP